MFGLFMNYISVDVKIPKCKIDSPNCFLHAHFVETRIKACANYVQHVEVNALTGNVILQIPENYTMQLKQDLNNLKDRLGNKIEVFV
jgi:hypothetical protein